MNGPAFGLRSFGTPLRSDRIHALITPTPNWPLTAPGGTVTGRGKHPESGGAPHAYRGKAYATLSPEQAAEVKAWAKQYFPAK